MVKIKEKENPKKKSGGKKILAFKGNSHRLSAGFSGQERVKWHISKCQRKKKSKRKRNLWINILPEKIIFLRIKEKNKLKDKTQSRQENKNEGSLSPLPLLCKKKKMLKGVLQIKIKNMVNCKAELYECIDLTSKGKIDTNTE